MINTAIAAVPIAALTQLAIAHRDARWTAIRSAAETDSSSNNILYYYEGEDSSLKISITPTKKAYPYTMAPHMLLVTDCRKFPEMSHKKVSHADTVDVRYGCPKGSAIGSVFYDARTNSAWVSDFGVSAQIKDRRRKIIAKLHETTIEQKRIMKVTRDLLRKESIINVSRASLHCPRLRLLRRTTVFFLNFLSHFCCASSSCKSISLENISHALESHHNSSFSRIFQTSSRFCIMKI